MCIRDSLYVWPAVLGLHRKSCAVCACLIRRFSYERPSRASIISPTRTLLLRMHSGVESTTDWSRESRGESKRKLCRRDFLQLPRTLCDSPRAWYSAFSGALFFASRSIGHNVAASNSADRCALRLDNSRKVGFPESGLADSQLTKIPFFGSYRLRCSQLTTFIG